MSAEQIVLHGDSRAIDFSAPEWREAAVLLTDPPYSAHVHANVTSGSVARGTRKLDLGFAPISADDRIVLAKLASAVSRWAIIFSDVEGAHLIREAVTIGGAEYIRTVPWVRWSMPQLSGDRPPTGQEKVSIFCAPEDSDCDVVLAHAQAISPRGRAKPLRKHWNGPGNLTHLAHKCLRGEGKHKAEKPLDLALDLVSWFSDPGDLIVDPYAGAGTFGVACRLLGRSYVGIEIDSAWVDRANARFSAPLSPRDAERLSRWIASDPNNAPQITLENWKETKWSS